MTDLYVYHRPVMLKETIESLNIQPDGVYVDLTFGGGGHSREILGQLSKEGHLYGFDQDLDAMEGAFDDPRFTFVRSNFRFLKNWMHYYGAEKQREQGTQESEDGTLLVDGILADLGVSSHHFDEAERGFSFRYDAPLDMRMNQKAQLTAARVVNEYSEGQLADIFYLYGELKQSRRLANVLAKARQQKEIRTTGQLAEVLRPLLGRDREKKDMAKLFQALRIEVNGEMKALQQMLSSAIEILKPGGRLVVLTYHSLEDRMVKNLMKSGNIEGRTEQDFFGNNLSPLRAIGKGMMTPSNDEQQQNPRSRSAKLRVAEKV